MIIRTKLVHLIALATIALAIGGLLALTAPALADHKPNHKPGGGGGEEPPPPADTGKIVFMRDLQTKRGADNIKVLVVRDLETSDETVLDPMFDFMKWPVWSHTGDVRWILVSGVRDQSDPAPLDTVGIWAIRENGEVPHPVLLHNEFGLFRPNGASLSRDDQWIAYNTFQPGGRLNIFIQRFDPVGGVISADSTPIQVLGFVIDDPDDPRDVTWSPDGLHLVFGALRPTEEDSFDVDLYRIDLQLDPFDPLGVDLMRVPNRAVILTQTDAVGERQPSYGVNGRVVFSRGSGVNFEGGTVHLNPNPDTPQDPLNPFDEKIVPGIRGNGFDWSPDATRIAFRSNGKGGAGTDVSVVSPDGNGLVNITDTSKILENYPAWRPNEFVDCNDNGLDDSADIAQGFSADCNANGVPDECDIAGGMSLDCNANGVPDECEIDPCP